MNFLSLVGSALVKGLTDATVGVVTNGSIVDRAKALAIANPVAAGAAGAVAVIGGTYATVKAYNHFADQPKRTVTVRAPEAVADVVEAVKN